MAVLTSLHACGFQLRGSINLSEDISPIYIKQGNMFDLARDIKLLMESNKIQVADSVGQSKSQLTLLNEEKSRRVLSVDSNGRLSFAMRSCQRTAILWHLSRVLTSALT